MTRAATIGPVADCLLSTHCRHSSSAYETLLRGVVQRLGSLLDHFDALGWVRISGGVSAADATAMRSAVWETLAQDGIEAGRPATWTVERPSNLQRLRRHVAFRWRPTEALQHAIASIVGTKFEEPADWGSAFIAFPTQKPWEVPHKGWHIDANYRSPLFPARGVKTLALIGNVEARGGGTLVLSGSHRLVHRWFQRHPAPPAARSAELRQLLRLHPYIDALFSVGKAEERIGRFMSCPQDDEGVPLQVVELTGRPGDVILMHPLLMHTTAPNNSPEPRLMISGGVTTNMWGWADSQDANA